MRYRRTFKFKSNLEARDFVEAFDKLKVGSRRWHGDHGEIVSAVLDREYHGQDLFDKIDKLGADFGGEIITEWTDKVG